MEPLHLHIHDGKYISMSIFILWKMYSHKSDILQCRHANTPKIKNHVRFKLNKYD